MDSPSAASLLPPIGNPTIQCVFRQEMEANVSFPTLVDPSLYRRVPPKMPWPGKGSVPEKGAAQRRQRGGGGGRKMEDKEEEGPRRLEAGTGKFYFEKCQVTIHT